MTAVDHPISSTSFIAVIGPKSRQRSSFSGLPIDYLTFIPIVSI